jgi:AbiV family abortive infection protein
METKELYNKGAYNCWMNCGSLEASARILYRDANKRHALYLLHIAYEELHKAIYCKFVSLGLVQPEDIDEVFRLHEPKAILFEKFFRDGATVSSDGVRFKEWVITKESLRALRYEKSKELEEYTKFKLRCLYIDKDNGFQMDHQSIPPHIADAKKKELEKKIQALELVYRALDDLKMSATEINGFKIEWRTNDEGRELATLSYDAV